MEMKHLSTSLGKGLSNEVKSSLSSGMTTDSSSEMLAGSHHLNITSQDTTSENRTDQQTLTGNTQ